MEKKPLLIFDLDGVIIDGICEYWWSSKKAALKIVRDKSNMTVLSDDVPQAFRYLRPWVKSGWEMVLLAIELMRTDSKLREEGYKAFADNYQRNRNESLEILKLHAEQLQQILDEIRRDSITNDLENWLAHHKTFPGITNRIQKLETEDIEFAVLTTKSAEFTKELLNYLNLTTKYIYGYESGDKPSVLQNILKNRIVKGFIEDRRATLEEVIKINELSSITCYLASWGYLKPNDLKNIPPEIHLLEQTTFSRPLAKWV